MHQVIIVKSKERMRGSQSDVLVRAAWRVLLFLLRVTDINERDVQGSKYFFVLFPWTSLPT